MQPSTSANEISYKSFCLLGGCRNPTYPKYTAAMDCTHILPTIILVIDRQCGQTQGGNNMPLPDPRYIPKGSMCGACTKRGKEFSQFCGSLPFHTYPIHKEVPPYIQVICKEYTKEPKPS